MSGRPMVCIKSILVVLGLVCYAGTANAEIKKHANKTLNAGVYRSVPSGPGYPTTCIGACEGDPACYGFVHLRASNLCNFVNRPIAVTAGGLATNSAVDFYEKVVKTPGTRTVKCTVDAKKAAAVARSKGFGFECFLYDHTVNQHNAIASSKKFDLVGARGPLAHGSSFGCVGSSPAGFQTLYVNLFRNRKLRNGWRLVDYRVGGHTWNVGPEANALIRLKSTRQYKKNETFDLRLMDIVLENKKTGWFFCDDAPADAF